MNPLWSKTLRLINREITPPDCGAERVSGTTVAWLLAGISAAALALRLFYGYMEPVISRDGLVYAELATEWFRSGRMPLQSEAGPIWVPPVYLWCVHLVMIAGASAVAAGVGLNIAIGALAPLQGYGLARAFGWGKGAGLWTAGFLAVQPTLVDLSTQLQRETLFFALLLAVLTLTLRGFRRSRNCDWAGAGFLLPWLAMTRYEGCEIILLILLGWGWMMYNRQLRLPTALREAAVLLAGAGVGGIALHLLIRIPPEWYEHYMRHLLGALNRFA